jgi:endonuclease I
MRLFIFSIVSIFTLLLVAQPPATYYNRANGKSDAQLKTELHTIISDGYKSKSYDYLYTIYQTSDVTEDGKVWDMYSTCTWVPGQKKCGNYKNVCDCYNREHSIPQSWFSSRSPMVSDAFHVYPTDGKVNGQRSSYPFGECASGTTLSNGQGRLGKSTFSGYSGTVFEPVDEYKGDFARTYFYFATRYENIMTTIGGESFNNTKYPAFTTWSKELFLKWHRQDPVSQKEITRNNAIYMHQNNRNPFIDYPELAEHIWGNRVGQPFNAASVDFPYLSMPTVGYQVIFGTVAYQHVTTIEMNIKGHNLTGELTLNISGENSSLFNINTNRISKEDAENGYVLQVTHIASSIGNHQAVLSVSGGGITPATIALKATSSDNFMAIQATDVSHDAFTANWTTSAGATGYELDVYTLSNEENGTIELIAEGFEANKLPSGWNSSGGVYYATTDQVDGAIRLASGSQDGAVTIPGLDLSQGEVVLSVIAKRYGSDTNANLTASLNGNAIATWLTGVDFATYSVNLPQNQTLSTLTLSASKGQRVYIDSVNISSEGETWVKTSIEGYPVRLGNTLSYQVTNLQENNLYYYDVIPIGNSTNISNRVEVQTTVFSNIDIQKDKNIYAVSTFSGIALYNLGANAHIELYNMIGECIFTTRVSDSYAFIPLKTKGIYIIKSNQTTTSESIKVIF